VFVSDESVAAVAPAFMPGMELHRLWGQDDTRAAPQDGTVPPSHSFFPPAGGHRVGTFTMPPRRRRGPRGSTYGPRSPSSRRRCRGCSITTSPTIPACTPRHDRLRIRPVRQSRPRTGRRRVGWARSGGHRGPERDPPRLAQPVRRDRHPPRRADRPHHGVRDPHRGIDM